MVKIILICSGRKYCSNFIISDIVTYVLNFPCPWISYAPHFLRNISKVCEFKYECLLVVQVCILHWNLNMIFFYLYIPCIADWNCCFLYIHKTFIRLFYFLAQKAHQLLLLYSVDYFQCPWLALYFLAEVWFIVLLELFSVFH